MWGAEEAGRCVETKVAVVIGAGAGVEDFRVVSVTIVIIFKRLALIDFHSCRGLRN